MDVLEDFYERRRRFKGLRKKAPDELVLLSYDVVKAFDKVQKFSVRASCERLNLPESFITYLLSTMTNATSSVRCKDGLTRPFALHSSVRQGTPCPPWCLFSLWTLCTAASKHTAMDTT